MRSGVDEGGQIISYPEECSRMDGVDLFPWVTHRRRIVILGRTIKRKWRGSRLRSGLQGKGLRGIVHQERMTL